MLEKALPVMIIDVDSVSTPLPSWSNTLVEIVPEPPSVM